MHFTPRKVWPPQKLREPIIHIGRAWFPEKYKEGKKWWLTGASDFQQWSNSFYGMQVWVKGNWTSGDVVPWPVPNIADEVTRYTLTALYEANKALPPLDKNSKYRGKGAGLYYGQYGFL